MQVGCDDGIERLRFHHHPHGHRIDQHLVARQVRELRRYLGGDLVPHLAQVELQATVGNAAKTMRFLQDYLEHRREIAREELMTCKISAVAVCWSRASRNSVLEHMP